MAVESPERAGAPAEVARGVLARLRSRIPCDGGALVLMDPVTGLFSTGAVDGLPIETCHPFFRVETGDDPRTLRALAVSGGGASAVSTADAGDPLVRDVLVPFGYAAELRAVLRDARVAWGGVSLWRRDRAFDPPEVDTLDALSAGLGAELRDAVLASLGSAPTSVVPVSAGMVVVADGACVESSEGLGEVLQEIDDPALIGYRHLEHLAALAQDRGRFSTVIRTRQGWLTAHGTPLTEGRVAITLTAADPARLFGARAAAAGLSARELEVTRLLCRGHTDREIARLLGVSAHTAHDHVRAVRRKLGVRSRSEVSALIFADAWFDDFVSSAALAHGS